MGAPGLAFETWDPTNQFPLETPTLTLCHPERSEEQPRCVVGVAVSTNKPE
jgi:hypothetical protein